MHKVMAKECIDPATLRAFQASPYYRIGQILKEEDPLHPAYQQKLTREHFEAHPELAVGLDLTRRCSRFWYNEHHLWFFAAPEKHRPLENKVLHSLWSLTRPHRKIHKQSK